MKVFVFVIGMLFALPGVMVAQEAVFQSANDLYARNEFGQAADQYQALVDSGFVAPALYFNLGNAYFKLNNMPRAILNYERALRLSPGDEAVKHNLELSRTFLYDRIEEVPDLFLIAWLKAFRDILSVRQWAWFSIGMFVGSLAFVLVFFFLKMGRLRYACFWAGAVMFFLSLVAFSGAGFQYRNVTSQTEAIIFSPVVTVKSAPGEGGTNLFILHEGTKVRIEETVGEWMDIRLPDGKKGWLRASDVEII